MGTPYQLDGTAIGYHLFHDCPQFLVAPMRERYGLYMICERPPERLGEAQNNLASEIGSCCFILLHETQPSFAT